MASNVLCSIGVRENLKAVLRIWTLLDQVKIRLSYRPDSCCVFIQIL